MAERKDTRRKNTQNALIDRVDALERAMDLERQARYDLTARLHALEQRRPLDAPPDVKACHD